MKRLGNLLINVQDKLNRRQDNEPDFCENQELPLRFGGLTHTHTHSQWIWQA